MTNTSANATMRWTMVGVLGAVTLWTLKVVPDAMDIARFWLLPEQEIKFWEATEHCGTVECIQVYIDKYPTGQFIAIANKRIAALTHSSIPSVASINTIPPLISIDNKPLLELQAKLVAGQAKIAQLEQQRRQAEQTIKAAELTRQLAIVEAQKQAIAAEVAALQYQAEQPVPQPIPEPPRQDFEPEMISIPAGCFKMGSSESEDGRSSDEGPRHRVCVDKFQMGKYEITNAQFRKFHPSHDSGEYQGNSLDDDEQPVVNVTWNDAVDYAKWLSQKTGKNYRLPTEAEWEYAARAETTTRFSFSNDDSDLDSYAWYNSNSSNKTHPVGEKQPNPWGLYDMHGNVREWCSDYWHSDYNGAPDNGSSWETGGYKKYHVLRGGSWYNNEPDYFRSANRSSAVNSYNGYGFRVVVVSFSS